MRAWVEGWDRNIVMAREVGSSEVVRRLHFANFQAHIFRALRESSTATSTPAINDNIVLPLNSQKSEGR